MVAAVEGWSVVGEMEKEKNDDLLASDPHMVLFSELVSGDWAARTIFAMLGSAYCPYIGSRRPESC